MTRNIEMVEVLVNGKWPIKLPSYRAERPEWDTGWEVERLDAMYNVIKPGDIVWDVGAEEGDMSGIYATWGAQLVLIEPNPLAWPNIQAIWQANDLPRPLAFWAGFADERTPEGTDIIRGSWPPCAGGPLIKAHGFLNLSDPSTVPRIALDDFLTSRIVPNVITIDVEGGELRVLLGARNLLKQHRPHVFVSVHPDKMRELYGDTHADLWAVMNELRYKEVFLGEDHEFHYHYIP